MMSEKTADFDYELPPELIAQSPASERTASRMLKLDVESQSWCHRQFSDIVDYFQAGDVLVINDTKVFPARLFGRKETGGKLACLVERLLDDRRALVHLKSSKSPAVGSITYWCEDRYQAEVVARHGELFELAFTVPEGLLTMLQHYGEIPLPPYMEHQPNEEDRVRYQTVFAEQVGAVAAPTAGLHFDETILQKIVERGVKLVKVTLHVGAGTFQPVRASRIADHVMHSEWAEVSSEACEVIDRAKAAGGRVVAVGTTSLRALESAAASGSLRPFSGDTTLFISPGYQFRCVDALLTNFHLPKSSLLMLVAALTGLSLMRDVYADAIREQYRFFSYGDCMLIDGRAPLPE